ncbi:MAG: DUF4430 domain-containing protein [Clostridia bacterium]|nr:DUF4430 domain-containing protein [Clostridia bacterium]
MKSIKKLSALILITAFAVIGNISVAANGNTASQCIESIISYNLEKSDAASVQEWIDTTLCETAGEGAEWYVIGLCRQGGYDFTKYKKALLKYLDNNETGSAVTRQKYALTLLATGSSDSYIQTTANNSIGEQGIMSLVFGLHLLNNGCTAKGYTKATLSDEIVSYQCDDGGWSVTGTAGDVDVTAMAIQALAPHYSDNSVRVSVNKALEFLSDRQEQNGGYSSYGVNNPESSAQVLTALSALGIDAADDERFIKEGKTVFDATKSFALPDGSYCHKHGGGSNGTATVQVFYSMVAYNCMKTENGSFYIFDNVNITDVQNTTKYVTTAVYEEKTESTTSPETEKQSEEKTTSKPKTTAKSTTNIITAYSGKENKTTVTEVTTEKEALSSVKTETTKETTTSSVTEEACTVAERASVTEQEECVTETEKEVFTSRYTEETVENIQSEEKRFNVKKTVIFSIVAVTLLVCIIIFIKGRGRLKNILFVLLISAVLTASVATVDFQSTDSYYRSAEDISNLSGTVTMSIRCDSIKNKGEEHIPTDGVILEESVFEISDNDTVYDVLQKASSAYRIHLETSKSGDSVYVEGIGNIYELQHGDLSGWMYYVNGESPSVGCGEYTLSPGDNIEWHYTCELGRDIVVTAY